MVAVVGAAGTAAVAIAAVGRGCRGCRGQQRANAVAMKGTKSQAIVKSTTGTILWMNTGRVYSPNPDTDLGALLQVVFPPLHPQRARAGARGRQ